MNFSDSHLIDNYFTGKKNGVVVECGADNGTYMPSTYLENFLGWKFIGFEPVPETYQELIKNRPNGLNINSGLSDFTGDTDFFICQIPGMSGISHNQRHIDEFRRKNVIFSKDKMFEKIKIKTLTWDDFLEIYNIDHVDLLILDVEGHEINVISGMNKALPSVIQIEMAYADPLNSLLDEKLKENFSGFILIRNILEKKGYEFNYVNFNNAYFSLKNFWGERDKPKIWKGSDDYFFWDGYKIYDRNKC